jgi:hypothetical protein
MKLRFLRLLSVVIPVVFGALFLMALPVQQARADSFDLGTAANYAVLFQGGGSGNTVQVTNVTVNGNIGVGGTGGLSFNGPGTIAGSIDFAAPNNGQYSNNNNNNVGPTSVNYSVAAVTSAVNSIDALAASLPAGIGNNLSISGAQTVNESAGALVTVGGNNYRVFNVTSFSDTNGQVLTVNGDGSGDAVVFNLNTGGNVNLQGLVALGGGLTSNQILFNQADTGAALSLNTNASSFTGAWQGILLDVGGAMSVVNANLNGEVFGGDSHDMQIVSGSTITPGVTTSAGAVPEAGTLSLVLSCGLLGLGIAAVKRLHEAS